MGLFNTVNVQEESEKAARTIQSFVDNGKIPPEVIAQAKGLAIFRAFRAGMYFAGTAGNGIVVCRLPDRNWSPPSIFSVKAGSIGIVYGVDVYDCVCVLNTAEAVDAYKKSEIQMGGGATLAVGPVGGASSKTSEAKKPVWVYTKSRGIYGGVTLDSTMIRELPAANEEFYGKKVTAAQILSGEIAAQDEDDDWPARIQQLVEVLRKIDNDEGAARPSARV